MKPSDSLFADALQRHQSGDRAGAEELYRRLLETEPGHVHAHNNLGVLALEAGRLDEAEGLLRRCVTLSPENASFHNNLGVLLRRRGRLDEAVLCCKEAARLKPDYAEAHNNLGLILTEVGQFEPAATHLREAIRLNPRYAEACNNLANVFAKQNQLEAAAALFQEALKLKADYAEAHANLGRVLADLGKLTESEQSLRESLRLAPNFADAHHNLAITWFMQHRFQESLASFDQSLRLRPDHADTHFNRSLTLLCTGAFEQGWAEYEWRLKRFHPLPGPYPAWQGDVLNGRTLLLSAEQGLGDTIQFVRFARLAKERGGKVIVACAPTLVELVRTCPGIDEVVAQGEIMPAFDVQCPLMSLPSVLRTTIDTIPVDIPYFLGSDRHNRFWDKELEAIPGLKVGVCWQGNPDQRWDRFRSFPLPFLESLAKLPGVTLVSLQHGPGSEQLEDIDFPVTDLSTRLKESGAGFLDTAGVIKNLDLLVSCDTVTAHLAGAMGIPVWLALASVADWRWMHGREDSPWYPTIRLFRQEKLGQWKDVFERITNELRKHLLASLSWPIMVELSPGELLDRIAILAIQRERLADPVQLRKVQVELDTLEKLRNSRIDMTKKRSSLATELKEVNEKLWDAKESTRLQKEHQDSGPAFDEQERLVFTLRERRSDLKRQIDKLLGSNARKKKSR